MNIQQLQYIIALEKHRHFLKASKACFITQATLSGMIKKMEEELNVCLFDRSKHPVQPTDIGKKIIAQSKVALLEITKIKEIVAQNKGEIKGDLRIGIIPSLAPYLLPLFIQHFMKAHKEVKLIINELTTGKIKEQLKEGIIDVAIAAVPLLDKNLQEETLFYEEFYHYGELNANKDNKKYILPGDINLNGLLLLEEGHCLRNQVINLCELRTKETLDLKLDYQSGSIETLKQMVDLNMGSTILPGLAVRNLTEEQKTKISTFVSPSPAREIGLIYYHHFAKKNMIDALKNSILSTIPKNMILKSDMCILPIK